MSEDEVKLWENSKERRMYSELANLYSVIKVIDLLEKAYASGSIEPEDYSKSCFRLLSQFKTTEQALVADGVIKTHLEFMQSYNMSCARALHRISEGVPATTMHRSHGDANESVTVAETVQFFITAMDALKLGQNAVDEIQPYIGDLMSSYNRVSALPSALDGKNSIQQWLLKFNKMRASDELSDDEVRQLSYDLENAYQSFLEALKK